MRLEDVCLLLVMVVIVTEIVESRKQYEFKQYTYRKKRDDRKYKNAKALCETRPECLSKFGAEQTACVRNCTSSFCYKQIYADDPLEDGEIDVRLNSFKGCLSQDKNNEHKEKLPGEGNLDLGIG
ncbi:uncharacterized protein LOC133189549 isoform X2 [Saccostrea echinata]|nr:uncharacterized protein LOC133189549 isoform X2 [Saccostrea echinata]